MLKAAGRPVDTSSVEQRARRYEPAREGERRAPQAALYSPEQLLGRAPIRLRRASDKRRLAAHLLAVVAMVALTAWWVLPLHGFAGPVVLVLTRTHGVHVGDVPSLLFVGIAARSTVLAGRTVLARARS